MIEEEYVLKPAYIVINGKVRMKISLGVKVNRFSDDFTIVMTQFSDTLEYLYRKANRFDIIGYDNEHPIILSNCVLTRNDLSIRTGQIVRGKFLGCKKLEEENCPKNSILQNLRKLAGDFSKNK